MNNNSNHQSSSQATAIFSLFLSIFSRMPNTPPRCRAPGMNTLLPTPIDNPTPIINIPTSISISSPPLLNPRFFHLLFSRLFFPLSSVIFLSQFLFLGLLQNFGGRIRCYRRWHSFQLHTTCFGSFSFSNCLSATVFFSFLFRYYLLFSFDFRFLFSVCRNGILISRKIKTVPLPDFRT